MLGPEPKSIITFQTRCKYSQHRKQIGRYTGDVRARTGSVRFRTSEWQIPCCLEWSDETLESGVRGREKEGRKWERKGGRREWGIGNGRRGENAKNVMNADVCIRVIIRNTIFS